MEIDEIRKIRRITPVRLEEMVNVPDELKRKIEQYVSEYPSIQKWFIEPAWRYEPSTMKDHIIEIDRDCEFSGVKTPDELANVSDIGKARGLIEAGWDDKRKKENLTTSFVKNRIATVNAFWEHNGRKIAGKEAYSGIAESRQKIYKRQRRWKLV